MALEDIETFYPASIKQWRQWLQKNHQKKTAVWVIYYKKSSGKNSISWSEAVDEALCFGWIDSTSRPIDHEKYKQYFTRRKSNSVWSAINKAKVQQLIDEGRMAQAGLDAIETAKKNGSWEILDAVENLTIPPDLEREFKKHKGAKDYFAGLSKSVRKAILQWLHIAKRDETRKKRLTEIAECAAQQQKPKPFRY